MASFGGVVFDILADDGSDLSSPDWESEAYGSVRHVPNSDIDEIQAMGLGSDNITLNLLFATTTACNAFKALRQTNATFIDWEGTSITNVYLERMTGTKRFTNGMCITTATFRQTTGTP